MALHHSNNMVFIALGLLVMLPLAPPGALQWANKKVHVNKI